MSALRITVSGLFLTGLCASSACDSQKPSTSGKPTEAQLGKAAAKPDAKPASTGESPGEGAKPSETSATGFRGAAESGEKQGSLRCSTLGLGDTKSTVIGPVQAISSNTSGDNSMMIATAKLAERTVLVSLGFDVSKEAAIVDWSLQLPASFVSHREGLALSASKKIAAAASGNGNFLVVVGLDEKGQPKRAIACPGISPQRLSFSGETLQLVVSKFEFPVSLSFDWDDDGASINWNRVWPQEMAHSYTYEDAAGKIGEIGFEKFRPFTRIWHRKPGSESFELLPDLKKARAATVAFEKGKPVLHVAIDPKGFSFTGVMSKPLIPDFAKDWNTSLVFDGRVVFDSMAAVRVAGAKPVGMVYDLETGLVAKIPVGVGGDFEALPRQVSKIPLAYNKPSEAGIVFDVDGDGSDEIVAPIPGDDAHLVVMRIGKGPVSTSAWAVQPK